MSKETLYGGRWKTGDGLGQGGQGHVFRATDTTNQLLGEFALKRIINPQRHERFRNEIEAIKAVAHPNIIPLIDHSALDAAASDVRPFLVMPIAEGGDVSEPDRLSLYTGSIEAVLRVAWQIASALEAAHAAGVIHRDVKPQNILFTGKGHNIWVSDFGICLIRGYERPTETGEIVGAHGFTSPELENGGRLDVEPAADVYSLGKLIFYIFSGGLVVPRETEHDERYDPLFANSERAQRLHFLLGQMVSPLHQRLKTMKEVIQALRTIEDWERNAHASPIGAEGLAAIEQLRRRAHKARQVTAENESARDQEKRVLQSVKEGFKSWLKAELIISVSQFGNDDNIEGVAGEAGDLGKSYRLLAAVGNQAYIPMTALEPRLRTAEDNFQRLHRLRIQLCEGPKAIVTVTAQVVGAQRSEPTAMPAQDPQLAMMPVYFQTAFAQGSNPQPALAGFLTKKAAVGTVGGQVPLPRRAGPPAMRTFRREKLTKTFHPGFTQCVPFRASQWLTVRDALQAGLQEAIDSFVDFVVSGATSVGP